jgi:large subunit ribosomal protein L3
MKYIIGKKLDMTQVWQGEKVVAVTKVLAGPCPVVQIKTEKQDGYSATQLGFDQRKEKNIKKPQSGHLKKISNCQLPISKNYNIRDLREFRAETKDIKVGDVIDVNTFVVGDVVKVTGISKGKGFQGGVKRHGWHGHNTTHGTKDQVRTSGSIGAGGVQHVLKGMRMPGRMGDERVTVGNLKIVQVDKDNNILYISGAIPGARNGLVLIQGEGELKIQKAESRRQTAENADTSKDALSAGLGAGKEHQGDTLKVRQETAKDAKTEAK